MPKEIKVCMGSACFAKGNQENLEFIKQYIEENKLKTKITTVGSLCENKCEEGPRLIIDGTEYTNVKQEDILKMLKG